MLAVGRGGGEDLLLGSLKPLTLVRGGIGGGISIKRGESFGVFSSVAEASRIFSGDSRILDNSEQGLTDSEFLGGSGGGGDDLVIGDRFLVITSGCCSIPNFFLGTKTGLSVE